MAEPPGGGETLGGGESQRTQRNAEDRRGDLLLGDRTTEDTEGTEEEESRKIKVLVFLRVLRVLCGSFLHSG